MFLDGLSFISFFSFLVEEVGKTLISAITSRSVSNIKIRHKLTRTLFDLYKVLQSYLKVLTEIQLTITQYQEKLLEGEKFRRWLFTLTVNLGGLVSSYLRILEKIVLGEAIKIDIFDDRIVAMFRDAVKGDYNSYTALCYYADTYFKDAELGMGQVNGIPLSLYLSDDCLCIVDAEREVPSEWRGSVDSFDLRHSSDLEELKKKLSINQNAVRGVHQRLQRFLRRYTKFGEL